MFTWNPLDYAGNSANQQNWARELISKLHLRGDERILDIGCGDGKVTAEIATHVPRGEVVGIDSSREMIAYAHQCHGRPPQVRFIIADASALPFDREFDVVFSNACLHWISDHRPVLAGIARALRPGGRVILQMGGAGNAADVIRTFDTVMSGPQWRPYFDDFSFRYSFHGPEEYERWLADAALRSTCVELIRRAPAHAGREGLAGWLRTTWMPYIQPVPPELRERYLDEVIDRYLQQHPQTDDGKVFVRMVRLQVEAFLPAA